MAPPRLLLLGVPTVVRDEVATPLTNAKGAALLAYLALNGPQPRERLLDILWPDSLPAAARKNLRNTLWSLGRTVGISVESEGERLALSPDLSLDVVPFEQGDRDALALYRGPLLDGIALGDAPDMDLWLTSERERLAAQFRRLAEQAIAEQRTAGNWRGVTESARRALAHEPLHEPFHAALIEGHARLGERPEALRQYDTLLALLDRELGVPPLPATVALRDAILTGTLAPTDMPPAAKTPRPRAAPTSPFVGRTSEQAALDVVLAEGRGRQQAKVALLLGDLGIGKSRLWQEWSARLPAEWAVLESRALAVTQSLPLAPIAHLISANPALRHVLADPTAVPSVWASELARLVPDVLATRTDLQPHTLPADEARHRLYEALARTLLALPARPLVLWVDDLHWADHATLDALGYLTHRLVDEPFLLVGAYRPAEETDDLRRQIEGWARAGILRPIAVPRLTEREAEELAHAVGGDSHRASTQSGGNPLFLLELSRAEADSLPPALDALLGARIARLPDGARTLLQAASILAPPIEFSLLTPISELSEGAALDALDALTEARLLVEEASGYSFAHPVLAEVVRDGMSRARQRILHRRAAEALDGHARPTDALAATLSVHWEAAGDLGRAAAYAERAGHYALSIAAFDEATDAFERALALEPTAQRALGRAQALMFHSPARFEAALMDALVRAQQANDPLTAARASQLMAQGALPLGHPDAVIHWAEKSLVEMGASSDPTLHAQAHYLLGAGYLQQGDLTEAEHHLAEAERLAREDNVSGVIARARFERGNLLAERGDLRGAVTQFEEAAALAHDAQDRFMETLAHNNAAYHAILLGDLARAHTLIAQALTLAESHGFVRPLQYLFSTRGELALAEAAWDEADAWFDRSQQEAERASNQRQLANVAATRALAARGRGDLDGARAWLLTARDHMVSVKDTHLAVRIELSLVEVAQALGDSPLADEALDRAAALLGDSERHGLRAWLDRLAPPP